MIKNIETVLEAKKASGQTDYTLSVAEVEMLVRVVKAARVYLNSSVGASLANIELEKAVRACE